MGRPCDCSGFGVFDPCTGCADVNLLDEAHESITLDMTGLSWPLVESQACSDDYTNGPLEHPEGMYRKWDWNSVSKDLANINGGITLRRTPPQPGGWSGDWVAAGTSLSGSDSCQWLWNEIEAINDRVQTILSGPPFYNTGVYEVENQYEPLNGSDSTNPWYREANRYTGVECNSGSGWSCGHTYWGNAVSLQLKVGSSTDPFGSGAFYWWLLHVWAVARYRVHYQVDPTTGPMTTSWISVYESISIGRPSLGTMAMNPDGSCVQTHDGASPSVQHTFGAILTYAKLLDCENDFLGDPITLDLHSQYQSRADALGVSYPSSCQITL